MPDDGQRYAVVGWKQWSELLTIQEFANAQYRRRRRAALEGHPGEALARRHLDAAYRPDQERRAALLLLLPQDRHRPCRGGGVSTDITWHGDRAAHFVSNMMCQGAVLVDDTGVVRMPCLEN